MAVSSKYRTQFKIIYFERSRKDKLKLKADSEAERDEWVEVLRKVTEQFSSRRFAQSTDTFRGGFTSSVRMPNPGLHKQLTLNQISDSLLQYKDQVSVRVQAQDQAFKLFKTELLFLSENLKNETDRDQLVKILKAAADWQEQQKAAFEFLSLTSKSLYTMVESIAEKEI